MILKKTLAAVVAATTMATTCAILSQAAPDSEKFLINGSIYSMSSDVSGTGWSWDCDTSTLTLSGYNGDRIQFETNETSDYSRKINVVISGENLITNSKTSYNKFIHTAASFSADCNISISGSGTVNIHNANSQYPPFSLHDQSEYTANSNAFDAIFDYASDGPHGASIDVSDCTINFVDCCYGFYVDKATTLTNTTISAQSDASTTKGIYSALILNSKEISVVNSTIVCDDICDVFNNLSGSVNISQSSISGKAAGVLFGSFTPVSSVQINDSTIDMTLSDPNGYWITYGFNTMNARIENSDVKISAQENIIRSSTQFFSVINSELDFSTIDETGFNLFRPRFTYDHPEDWKIYTDGIISDNTVETENITDFGENHFEIRYSHLCDTFTDWNSDGEDTHTRECTECEKTETEDHTWNDGIVTKEAEVGVAGETTYTCTKCGETYTEEIPALEEKPDTDPPSDVPEEDDSPKSEQPSDKSSAIEENPKTGNSVCGLAGIALSACAITLSKTLKKKF